MIHNSNIVVITTTLPKNTTSEKRRNNLINNFSKWNIPILFNHGIIDKTISSHLIMFKILYNALEIFKKYDTMYAIICDDDFFPIDNFLEELNKTIILLPDNWRCLHLCPGYLWGRWFRDKTKISLLNPEYNMDNIPYDKSGRFYINCDSNVYCNKHFWLGGPIAMVVNKANIDSLIDNFVSQYNKQNLNNDVILTQILNNNDYICRQPMLGYENEEGGSTFH